MVFAIPGVCIPGSCDFDAFAKTAASAEGSDRSGVQGRVVKTQTSFVVLALLFGVCGAAVASPSPAVAQERDLRPFTIPPQPLSSALLEFAEQSGLDISFDSRAAAERTSFEVNGNYTPEQALDLLLAGTGLTYTRAENGTITLLLLTPEQGGDNGVMALDTVRIGGSTFYGTAFDPVEGFRAGNASTATRSDAPLLDTPASVSVVTGDILETADVQLLEDIADIVPGLTRSNNFGGTRDRFLSRGFEADILVNGTRRGVIGITDTYRVQRVETLRGPSGALYGSGGGGGQVNVVTKRPLYEPFAETRLSGRSQDGGFRGTVDISQPLTEDGGLAVRLNAAGEYEDTFRDFVTRDFYAVAPSVRWDVTADTSVLLEGEITERNAPFDRGIPIVDNDLAASVNTNFSEPDAGDTENAAQSTQLTLQHFLGDVWSVTGRVGFNRQTLEGEGLDNRALAPFSFAAGTPLPLLGPGAVATDAVVAGDTIFRNRTIRDQERRAYSADAVLDGAVVFADMQHNLTFATDFRRSFQENRDNRSSIDFTDASYYADPCNISISNPVYGRCGADASVRIERDLDAHYLGFSVQNRIEISPEWQFLIGMGYTTFRVESDNLLSDEQTVFDGDSLHPQFGLVYKATPTLSLYGNYREGFGAEPDAIRIDPVTEEVLPPTEFQLFETGVKQEWFDGRLAATLSLFHQKETGLIHLDPSTFDLADPSAARARDNGKHRSRGVELELAGGLTDQWDVLFSYAFTDAEVRQGFEEAGSDLQGVPRHKIGLLTRYRFDQGLFEGLSVGGSWVFEGKRRTRNLRQPDVIVNPANGDVFVIDDADDLPSETVPSYHRFDLFASYEPIENVGLFFRVENVLDEDYATSPDFLIGAQPGAPRTISGGLTLRF